MTLEQPWLNREQLARFETQWNEHPGMRVRTRSVRCP